MSKVDHNAYGMLYDKKIFFNTSKHNNLIEKMKRILQRIGAEIVEQFNGDNCHIVIIDNISMKTEDRKRKSSTPITHQLKKLRLNSLLNNDSPDKVSSSTLHRNPSFLIHAKEKGAKIKSINDVWQWLNQYYKLLVEMDEPDNTSNINYAIDKYCSVRALKTPALKILDPFGGTRPILLENHSIETEMWYEFRRQGDREITSESRNKRRSAGTSTRRMTKPSRDALIDTGFCECCQENYLNLYQHITSSESHTRYANDPSKYAKIDSLCFTVGDISKFFLNRAVLWTRHKQARQSLAGQVPRSLPTAVTGGHSPVSSPILPPPLHRCTDVIETSNAPLPDQHDSSSDESSYYSSSSSTGSSSSSSSSSCSDDVPSGAVVTGNSMGSLSLLMVSSDSVSADENHQDHISSHVNSVIEHLDTFSCHGDLSPPIFSLRSVSLSRSPVLEPRFRWCPSCHRNHIPKVTASSTASIDVDEEQQQQEYRCQFSQPDTSPVNIDADIDIIDLNSMMMMTAMSGDGAARTDQSNTVDIATQVDIKQKSDNQLINRYCVDIDATSEDRLLPIVLLSDCIEQHDRSLSINTNNNNDRGVTIDHNTQAHASDLSSGDESRVDRHSSREIGELDFDKENDRLLVDTLQANRLSRDFTTENSAEQKTDNLNQLMSCLSANDNEIALSESRPIINAVRTLQNRKKSSTGDQSPIVSNDSRCPRRKSSIAANQGIINTNLYFSTAIDNTVRALKESYKPGQYDPRVILGALKYSTDPSNRASNRSTTPAQPSAHNTSSQSVLRDRNL